MKQAFTLIDLIISIVVIGLAFSAIPLMLQQESNMEIENIKQEAVMIALIKAGNILSYAWDEKIAGQRELGVKDKVLDVKNSNYNRYPDINSTHRIGHFKVRVADHFMQIKYLLQLNFKWMQMIQYLMIWMTW